MRVAALSDFHIGVTAARDGFRHDPARFSAFLDRLEAEHDHIILVGDIFQTDHGPLPTARGRSRHLRRAQARVGELAAQLAGPKYVYVFGNHDEIAGKEGGASESITLQSDGVRLHFTHGHQFDPVAVSAPLAADVGTWVTGRLRAVGLRPAAAWLEGRDIEIKDRRFRGPAGPYARGATELARTHAADVVVMGHTHCARVDAIAGGPLVANTGTCSGARFTHVTIDTDERRLRVVENGRERTATF